MDQISATEFEKMLADFPVATYEAGQIVISAGSRTGLLFILKSGAVAVFKKGVEIAKVVEPGSMFGEMSALLSAPHTVEVRAVERSQFKVADAAIVMKDPVSLPYIATLLARRLDAANQALFELKSQLKDGKPAEEFGKMLRQIDELLNNGGAIPPGPYKMRFFTSY